MTCCLSNESFILTFFFFLQNKMSKTCHPPLNKNNEARLDV